MGIPKVPGLDHPIILAGVHFLSNPSDSKKGLQREAQATAVANAVEALKQSTAGQDAHAIILGDYNTFNNDALDVNGNQAIDKTVDIIEASLSDVGIAGTGYDVVGDVPVSERYSEWWDRNGDCAYDPFGAAGSSEVSLLDHLVVSPALRELISDVTIHHDWPGTCLSNGGYWSDHYPVSVTFDLSGGGGTRHDDCKCDVMPTDGC